jgi:N6-L-threonylcarbamoyladenine synthase
MLILGIETSCDETAAAVVRDGRDVLSNSVYSQVAQHAEFGGVVPEIAARSHVEILPGTLERAMRESGVEWASLDAVSVTCGPGLATSLLVGLSAAKALAYRLARPLRHMNHLEAHLYSVFLDPAAPAVEEACPMLVLLVTGGNTVLVRMDGIGRYHVLGQTLDDAAGEALDKGATLMGLGYPGGPAIEATAQGGNPHSFRFPRGLEHPHGPERIHGMDRRFCFSFSGLKTALLYYLRDHPDALRGEGLADVAASYQEAVFDALLRRVDVAIQPVPPRTFACVGGVARNRLLRSKLAGALAGTGIHTLFAPPQYCTDNAAMIAGLAGHPGGPLPLDDPFAADIQPGLTIRS